MDNTTASEIKLKAFFGLPYAYSTICFIYPLTIKDIVTLGQLNYSSYLSLLTSDEFDIQNNIKKKGIDIRIENIEPFNFIINSAKVDYSFLLELKNAFRTFIREEINILFDEQSIIIGDGSDKRILNSENFLDFQNIIRLQNRRTAKIAPPPNESPIQRKFRLKAEYRDSIKRNQKGKGGDDALDLCALLSILCCYTKINPQDLEKYSFFAFKEQLERYQMKDKFDLDIRSLLAGADSKKVKPESWQKKIND